MALVRLMMVMIAVIISSSTMAMLARYKPLIMPVIAVFCGVLTIFPCLAETYGSLEAAWRVEPIHGGEL